MSKEIEKEFDKIHELEKQIIFEEFNSNTAWEIGNMLYERLTV